MRNFLTLPALLILAACDGGAGGGTLPKDGPVEVGFVNTRQSAEASTPFAQPVIAKATRPRTASAPWFSLVTPLYADTATVGAPAAGVETCFFPDRETENGGPLNVPVCKTTGQDGKASFTFGPGTRAATYRLPACVKNAQNICEYPDTVVLVVLPKAPVAATVRVGETVQYGTLVSQPGRVTFPENLFTAAGGAPAAYRVQGTRFLAEQGDTLGSIAARQVQIAPDAQVGDTATVTFHSATKRIGTARAVVAYRVPVDGRVDFIIEATYLELSVP